MADHHRDHDHDLSSPLLQSPRSDHSPVIISIEADGNDTVSDPATQDQLNNHDTRYHNNPGNPYWFIGSDGLSVPGPNTANPFLNDTPHVVGVYEFVKIVVCFPIVLIRLVLFGFCLLVGYLATKLALEGWKDKQNPMPVWRSRLIYHWIRRKGKPAPRQIAPIVVSNHISYIEPIFFFYELFPTIVASESHDSIPFVGTIIRAMQVIYVDRFSQSSRKNAVSEIKRKASCDRFPRVLLFPEGTTTNGKFLISFQLGAFIPAYPIQPVIVRYPHVHFDQSWGDVSLGKLMFRMFTQFHNFMEVEYLPVVFPSDNQKENALRFAERTSHAMASALNAVQTSHAYGDLMLLMKASELKEIFHISSLEAVNFLEKFLSMNPDPSGCVKLLDFLSVLRLKTCPLSDEFLYASAHVMKLPLFWQACELAFAECDPDGNGFISENQLEVTIRPAIPDLNKYEIDSLFRLFDSDGDGRVSRDDFICCLRKNPLLIAIFSPTLLHTDLSEARNRMPGDVI
ncbi:Lysophospholipid acyltransferase LPEAT2 [Citrus sinensis]|nr:Lysophospholipid acyltransferase LPEAT2 [Citrus sinensis]